MDESASVAVDWSLLNDYAVQEAINLAVGRVYTGDSLTEKADLCQEATIIVATNARVVQAYLDGDQLGFLYHWLFCKLTDVMRKELSRTRKNVSLENLIEAQAA